MAKTGRLYNQKTQETLLTQVRWCDSFICKLKGLMFRRSLNTGEGLLLVEEHSSRSATAIHMLFMAFPIATIWLDENFQVVDKVLAKPWRPAYIPAQPARYTLEASPATLESVQVGDILIFEEINE